jgi:hypothetical protein
MNTSSRKLKQYSSSPRWYVWKAVLEWYWQGRAKELQEKLSKCHFIHHKSHMDCPEWVRGRQLMA